MRFDSRLPDDSVNVAQGSVVREAILLVVGVAGAAALLTAILAFSVEALVPLIPPQVEVRVFGALADAMSEESPDEEIDPRTEQVQAIVDRLAAQWGESPYERFVVMVLDDPMPNAFALPGGAIVVTAGLLDRIETENELAFVLGHEIGHFAGRDHLRGIGRGLAIAIALGAVGLNGDSASGLAQTASSLSARHFDRDQESDADRFGVGLLVAEYGHAGGSNAVFERVLADGAEESEAAEAEPKQTGRLERATNYLSTHPLGPARIEALEVHVAKSGWVATGPLRAWVPAEHPDEEVVEAVSEDADPGESDAQCDRPPG